MSCLFWQNSFEWKNLHFIFWNCYLRNAHPYKIWDNTFSWINIRFFMKNYLTVRSTFSVKNSDKLQLALLRLKSNTPTLKTLNNETSLRNAKYTDIVSPRLHFMFYWSCYKIHNAKKNKKQKHATRRYLSCVILKSRMLQHFNLVDSSRTSVFT